ncbi:TetR family transcriptional regulator [Leptolyngbya sp. FACHB-261]|uniref:TetR family transcriptional regulator n=1 Tax=Leptolyngbya sp. FACHB-261 TaxID=2692806 RepID=UPI0016829544|nr:TetR family transcriptional regulator [Leptolyngbya sp. FACHB-261]
MPYDAEATKRRIFEAAAAEFAERGIAGARINQIAERARANKQLIYAYFGDKEQLFAAVLQQRLEQLAEAVVLDPDRVPEYVGELFDFHAANPDLVRLVLWEALHCEPGQVPNQAGRAERYRETVTALVNSQSVGKMDASLEPRHTLFMLLSLAGWWFAAPQVAHMMINADPSSAPVLANHRAHIVEAARRLVASTTSKVAPEGEETEPKTST